MLRSILQRINTVLFASGFNPRAVLTIFRHLPRYMRDLQTYRRLSAKEQKFQLQWRNVYPIVSDYDQAAGNIGGHYFHQDLWAARKIYASRPEKHIDISSRLDGFVAHVLCFMPIEVIDIRPLNSDVEGLTFVQEDATTLTRFTDSSIVSISSLHAIEHFGLGRYNDLIDPLGYFQVMRSLARVLAVGGHLYLSVPIGRERVEFNAHRVFSPSTIIEILYDLKLVSFSAVNDLGHLEEDARMSSFHDAEFACGLFEFTKVSTS